jgi:hypothetical protein
MTLYNFIQNDIQLKTPRWIQQKINKETIFYLKKKSNRGYIQSKFWQMPPQSDKHQCCQKSF